MVVGILSLALRESFMSSLQPTTTNKSSSSSLQFTISFEQRQDVLLATSPTAAKEMNKYMKRKKRAERLAMPENESASESEDSEGEATQADEEYQDDDDGDATVRNTEEEKDEVGGEENAIVNDDIPMTSTTSTAVSAAEIYSVHSDVPTYEQGDRVLYDDAASGDVPFCTREQIINGQWYRVELEAPPYIIHTVHLRCYPRDAYYTAPWVHHEWIPQDSATGLCRYPDTFFDADAFCRLTDSTTISVVGDSLSWEHYRSLLQLLGLHPHQNFQHQSRELETNIIHRACDGRVAVLYKRDDKLSNVTASIEQNFPTVLVLNRGAHFTPWDELLPGIQRVIGEVRTWLNTCAVRGLTCHFFWRTSVPGHPQCQEAQGPVNDLEAMEHLIEDRATYNERSLTYHWYDYQQQNELVVEEFRKANLASFEVLDGYYLLVRRPDEHRAHQNDCLHNCYPGKVDVYNQLLWHYLQAQRSDEAITQQQGQDVPEATVYDPDATEAARKRREAAKKDKNKKRRVLVR